jgi:hypothetical protein
MEELRGYHYVEYLVLVEDDAARENCQENKSIGFHETPVPNMVQSVKCYTTE